MNNVFRIAFWGRDKNMLSHKDGLTAEDIANLQTLKVGDRLIIWDNKEKRSDRSPDYTLKVFLPKEKFEQPPEGVVLTESSKPTSGFKPVK